MSITTAFVLEAVNTLSKRYELDPKKVGDLLAELCVKHNITLTAVEYTAEDVAEWFAAKGGLSINDLRLKAVTFGIDTEGLDKKGLKARFLAQLEDNESEADSGSESDDDESEADTDSDDDDESEADSDNNDESEADSDSDSDDNDESEADAAFTADQVEEWFQTPTKGGLALKELRAKAEAAGLETKGVKKEDLKAQMLKKAGKPTTKTSKPTTKASKPVAKKTAAKTSQCEFVPKRGKTAGTRCSASATSNGVCSKHASKASTPRVSVEKAPAKSSGGKVKRNKDLNVWVLADHPEVVVTSPTNHSVVGVINKKGEVVRKLTAAQRSSAEAKVAN